jgi:hypothetical protein
MDGRTFDTWLRTLTESRRSVLRGSLGLIAGMVGVSTIEAKKKKKKCAKKCPDGCCTSTRGKCILPAQQNAEQCGTGGEICRTNCGGQSPPLPETCGATNCQGGCCAGTTCEFSTHAHCGIGGAACVPCGATEDCFAGKCCGLTGHVCAGDGECCLNRLCESGKCCSPYSIACSKDSDCCDPDTLVCSNGECLIKNGQPCELLQRCQGNQPCPGSLICGDVEGCTEEQDDACVAQFPNGGCTIACGAPCCVGHRECASSCEAAQTCLEAACTPIL